MAKRLITVNDILAGHVSLDVACLDRIYLNGYLPTVQVPGQVVQFLQHRGFPIPSPAVVEKMGTRFRDAVKTFAEVNRIPVVRFGKNDRKLSVMQPHLDRQAATGRAGVAAIGVAQEFQRVFTAATGAVRAEGGAPHFSWGKADRRVTAYYFYLWDEDFGPGFIKICAYFPYPIKIWLNGHHWTQRQAAQAGIGVTPLAAGSNSFAGTTDPAGLQAICDRLGPSTITVFAQRWWARLPLPLTPADRKAGYWWDLSMRQVEVSRTLVFDRPANGRLFFDALVTDNLDVGRPDQIELIFGRRVLPSTTGVFATRVVTRGVDVTVNALYRHSRVKQYFKEGRALRIETVVNDAGDLGCRRRLVNLDELQAKARDVNDRLLHHERVGQGCVLASPAFERIARPTLAAGRRAPALRFGDPRVMALAGALASCGLVVGGFSNQTLRPLVAGLLGPDAAPYTQGRCCYDLRRLKLKGLIVKIEHTNTYVLTPDGQRFAVFYTKVHNRLLRPLLAADRPPAPLPVRQALRTLDRAVTDYVSEARMTA